MIAGRDGRVLLGDLLLLCIRRGIGADVRADCDYKLALRSARIGLAEEDEAEHAERGDEEPMRGALNIVNESECLGVDESAEAVLFKLEGDPGIEDIRVDLLRDREIFAEESSASRR